MKTKTSPKSKPKRTTKYKATIETVDGLELYAEGDTAADAFLNIKGDYTQIKAKGYAKLKKGRKKSGLFFYLRPLKRLVVNKLMRAQVGRNLEFLLK